MLKICHTLMRNKQSTNQCAAQSCSFPCTSSETMDFRGKACSKNDSSLERVDSRVQHRWSLRVMGSCFTLFCRRRHGIILECVAHVQYAYILPGIRPIKFLLCDVVIPVAVVYAKAPWYRRLMGQDQMRDIETSGLWTPGNGECTHAFHLN